MQQSDKKVSSHLLSFKKNTSFKNMSSEVYFFISSHFAAFSCSLWISRWPLVLLRPSKQNPLKVLTPYSLLLAFTSSPKSHPCSPTLCLQTRSQAPCWLSLSYPVGLLKHEALNQGLTVAGQPYNKGKPVRLHQI